MDYYKQTNETKRNNKRNEQNMFVCVHFRLKWRERKRVIRIRRVKIWHKSLKETTWERGDKTIKSWIYEFIALLWVYIGLN